MYKIYPSMLDAFQRFLESGEAFEDSRNQDAEGDYKRTEQEIADEREQDLLNLVNRVPFTSEAASRGTCFNEIIDRLNNENNNKDVDAYAEGEGANEVIVAKYGDNTFRFEADLCRSVAAYFVNAATQYYTEAVLPTRYGDVLLYGYIDEVLPQKVCDIKTTSRYTFRDYERKWQRHVYPYCLVESGDMQVPLFEYTVVQLQNPTRDKPFIRGVMYAEQYTYNHEQTTRLLQAYVERFIEWLENNRFRITDKKVFGYDND